MIWDGEICHLVVEKGLGLIYVEQMHLLAVSFKLLSTTWK